MEQNRSNNPQNALHPIAEIKKKQAGNEKTSLKNKMKKINQMKGRNAFQNVFTINDRKLQMISIPIKHQNSFSNQIKQNFLQQQQGQNKLNFVKKLQDKTRQYSQRHLKQKTLVKDINKPCSQSQKRNVNYSSSQSFEYREKNHVLTQKQLQNVPTFLQDQETNLPQDKIQEQNQKQISDTQINLKDNLNNQGQIFNIIQTFDEFKEEDPLNGLTRKPHTAHQQIRSKSQTRHRPLKSFRFPDKSDYFKIASQSVRQSRNSARINQNDKQIQSEFYFDVYESSNYKVRSLAQVNQCFIQLQNYNDLNFNRVQSSQGRSRNQVSTQFENPNFLIYQPQRASTSSSKTRNFNLHKNEFQ